MSRVLDKDLESREITAFRKPGSSPQLECIHTWCVQTEGGGGEQVGGQSINKWRVGRDQILPSLVILRSALGISPEGIRKPLTTLSRWMITITSQKAYYDHRMENGLVDMGTLETENPVQEDGIIVRRSDGSLKENGDSDRKMGVDLRRI